MKNLLHLVISAVLLGGTAPAVQAQGPEPPPNTPALGTRDTPHKQSFRRGPRGERMKKAGHMKYVETWLERLGEKDPGEFERLSRLREKDPEAFRAELRARLRQERMKQSFKDFPQIAAALQRMNPEDRKEFLNQIGPRAGGGRSEGGPDIPRELHQQIRKLAEAYALADNEDLRRDIRAQLKARLGQIHQARQEARINHVQKIEQQLEKLRTSIEEDQQNREAFIEKQLNRILQPSG